MNGMRQMAAICNQSDIPRHQHILVICVGIAGVVAYSTVLAMATGLKATLANAARDDRAVLGSGSLAGAELISATTSPRSKRRRESCAAPTANSPSRLSCCSRSICRARATATSARCPSAD